MPRRMPGKAMVCFAVAAATAGSAGAQQSALGEILHEMQSKTLFLIWGGISFLVVSYAASIFHLAALKARGKFKAPSVLARAFLSTLILFGAAGVMLPFVENIENALLLLLPLYFVKVWVYWYGSAPFRKGIWLTTLAEIVFAALLTPIFLVCFMWVLGQMGDLGQTIALLPIRPFM